MKQSAMKPRSAAKKMLLLGGYFASIWDKEGQRRYMEKSSIRDKEGQRRYMEKLSIIGGFDPYESERNECQDDVDLWPSATYIHLGMYLLVNPSPYTGEDLMNYKSLDCYINFVSGWVREVFVRKVNDKRVIIVKVSHTCLDHQGIVPTYVCIVILQVNHSH